MIKSFSCKDTERLFNDKTVKRFKEIENSARRKLELIDAAISIKVLAIIPGNRLEKLKGPRKGQWSIRINDQWRICFILKGQDAHEVEICDYH
ncbi:type II toxin-antitoxin system RelE/ParE family toxin [bacterium]|nr:type II toxin-antitoxin system RelE/ParE family toxin [bacterium]